MIPCVRIISTSSLRPVSKERGAKSKSLVGPEAAGKFGFTLSIIAVVNGYAQIWIAARAPVFASLNSSGKWDELGKLFRKSLISGTVTYAIGSIFVILVAFLVQY